MKSARNDGNGYSFYQSLDRLSQTNEKVKLIEFQDIWEQFTVSFSIYLPSDEMADQAFMEIISK